MSQRRSPQPERSLESSQMLSQVFQPSSTSSPSSHASSHLSSYSSHTLSRASLHASNSSPQSSSSSSPDESNLSLTESYHLYSLILHNPYVGSPSPSHLVPATRRHPPHQPHRRLPRRGRRHAATPRQGHGERAPHLAAHGLLPAGDARYCGAGPSADARPPPATGAALLPPACDDGATDRALHPRAARWPRVFWHVDAEQGQMARRFYPPAFLLVVLSSVAGQAMNVSAVDEGAGEDADDLLRADLRPPLRRQLHVAV